jgi:hypothetical protein
MRYVLQALDQAGDVLGDVAVPDGVDVRSFGEDGRVLILRGDTMTAQQFAAFKRRVWQTIGDLSGVRRYVARVPADTDVVRLVPAAVTADTLVPVRIITECAGELAEAPTEVRVGDFLDNIGRSPAAAGMRYRDLAELLRAAAAVLDVHADELGQC